MSILDAFKLDGQVALVTGGNRGIGRGMAEGLAEAGADIVNLSRGPDPGDIRCQVEALGRRLLHIQCELSEASVARLREVVDQIVREMGRLDILVNNAGIIPRAPAIDYSEADWDAVLQINLKAAFFLAQAAARVMIDQGGGKIINIASVLSYQGGISVPSYVASKHGTTGITRALANEWAQHNINVNAIAPGYFITDFTHHLVEDETRYQALTDRMPVGRWGRPEDLKGTIVFLASAASSYVHGVILPVDGAWLTR
ncbi:MAG: 2-dehydro-3-deoxy-D-gluconate 5-dehydrogenase KduD [Candidatus Tectomicrobia bacterium]